MNNKSRAWNIISWIFCIVFFVIGVLNVFLVHIIPGVFYILLTFFYFPPATTFIKKRFSFLIPPLAKIILGLVILWGTLAGVNLWKCLSHILDISYG